MYATQMLNYFQFAAAISEIHSTNWATLRQLQSIEEARLLHREWLQNTMQAIGQNDRNRLSQRWTF